MTYQNKFKLYTFLMQNGFEPLINADLFESHIPAKDLDEIKTLFETYKKNNFSTDPLNAWIGNILSLRQHYKHDAFFNLLSDIFTKKAELLQSTDQYREIYLLLAKILAGEFPDIQNISQHTIMVIFVLLQELDKLVESVNSDELYSCLQQSDPNSTSHDDDHKLIEQLMSLFKFQKINEFFNPLQISRNVNQAVYENIFK